MPNKYLQGNGRDRKNNFLPSKWVLIFDWPGLDKVHPFRVTRLINENNNIFFSHS
jgi:hypothetical protein